MKANIGDVISWEFDGLEYCAEVVAISNVDPDTYIVYISYDNWGFRQEKITDSDVLRVWRPKNEND